MPAQNEVWKLIECTTYVEILSLFVIFERQPNEVSDYCSLFYVTNFLESDPFAGWVLVF